MSIKIDNIENPMGIGSMAISVKTLKDQIKSKYKEFTESTIEVSAMKNKDTYILWFVIPSKENKEFPGDVIFYDILIELTPPGSSWKTKEYLREYDVRVFNNNPRFMFAFDYAYNKRHGLINLPSKFYNKYALKTPSKKRNPLNLLGLDEDLYHAVMYMDKHHLFDRDTLDTLCLSSNLTMKELLSEVVTQDEKMKEVTERDLRHRAGNRHKNSKVWEQGSDKAKIKQQLLEESKNLAELRARNPTESKLLKTQMLANLRSRLSLTNLRTKSAYSNSLQSNLKSSLNKNSEKKENKSSLKSSLSKSSLHSSL